METPIYGMKYYPDIFRDDYNDIIMSHCKDPVMNQQLGNVMGI